MGQGFEIIFLPQVAVHRICSYAGFSFREEYFEFLESRRRGQQKKIVEYQTVQSSWQANDDRSNRFSLSNPYMVAASLRKLDSYLIINEVMVRLTRSGQDHTNQQA
ncbi:hypothetical protein BGX29_003056 [Mortierella sp. GBA35]|nr:hypothetical protein BGX29_003056 [Mortierella sp. GBA35]